MAGNYNIPEVTVYFRHRLMRGNRTVKVSSDNLDAFSSPNLQPLAVMGINIEVDYKAIHRPRVIEKFKVHSNLNSNVVLLRLFPSIRTETIGKPNFRKSQFTISMQNSLKLIIQMKSPIFL